jgi:hypothetical protein
MSEALKAVRGKTIRSLTITGLVNEKPDLETVACLTLRLTDGTVAIFKAQTGRSFPDEWPEADLVIKPGRRL